MADNKFRQFIIIIGIPVLLALIYLLVTKKSAAEKNRDEISIVLNNIAANAQTHYKRTNNFEGWTIPSSLRIDEVGTFRELVEYNQVIVYVVGNEIGENGKSHVNIASAITGNDISVKIRN